MKSIQSALNSWKPNPQINESINHLRVELLRDPLIVSALQNKPNITEKVLDNSLIKLFEYKKEHQNCQECPGLQSCPNMMKGYQPDITVNREALELTYHPCSLKLDEEQQKNKIN
ncbi:primosomal protein DnaI [Bacillus sp. TS-2]|nr:primosomal protein DnaI [Bacillus sp. TS-2]